MSTNIVLVFVVSLGLSFVAPKYFGPANYQLGKLAFNFLGLLFVLVGGFLIRL
jgi:hypothetical protein